MIASIDVAMGGRAAEELFLGNDEITTGILILL
jgi:ATP-dependent Zn protease